MDRKAPHARYAARLSLALALATLVPSTGCLHLLLATGIYMWEGGNRAPAECDVLDDHKVVVLCQPPAAQEFRHAGASRHLAKRVASLLALNLTGADVVPQRKVDAWLDENDSDDFKELGRAVGADYVVHIELGHFDLFAGQTVYQGNSDVTVAVYDMEDRGRLVWDKPMGEVLFPIHGQVPVQEKSVSQFQRDYIEYLASEIGKHFYPHDPHANFAIDAIANH